ncbi:MAG: class I SAM-dependent methyltransferase [Candidatus Omnitrophota bacterium]
MRRLKNFIGLKLMSFFIRLNFRLITMCNERIFEYPWVLTRCKAVRGDKIGDFGCKGSMLVPYLSSLGFQVYGVDLAEGLDFSSHFLDNYKDFKFVKSDIRKMPFPDSFFDVSFSISTLEHIFSDDNSCEDNIALQEIVRVTKSGGRILLSFRTEAAM